MEYTERQSRDRELLLQLKNKDEKAFSYVYDKYAPLLYGVILKRVPNEKLASEILKRAFIKIWNECKNLDCVNENLFTWLLSLTNKTAVADFKINLEIKLNKKVGIA